MGVSVTGYGCGKIPCIYILEMAAVYRGMGGSCVAKKTHLLQSSNIYLIKAISDN